MSKLAREKVQSILAETAADFPHGECLTCECFLGLVVQLRVDSEPAGKEYAEACMVDRKQQHGCLGCDPCPPGDRYAAYMRDKHSSTLITL